MADIYNRATDSFGGAFAADQAKLVFPGIAGVGLLTQNMQAQYQQQITRLYELGSNKVYYVAGRTSGTLSIQRVEGPRKLGVAFLQKYGNVCNAVNNNLEFSLAAGCDGGGGEATTYTCLFTVVQAITIGVAAQDVIINNGIQAMFSSLLYN